MPSVRFMTGLLAAVSVPLAAAIDWDVPTTLLDEPLYGAPENDFSCRSDVHPNPIITLHGLSADRQVDLNQLAWNLTDAGYCVFSKTYGAHTLVPWIGGVTEMRDSAREVADFIREVKEKTGADKVDLVGHSEGAVMALYVPMTQDGIPGMVERTVGLGPAVHGAEYFGFTDLFYLGGDVTRDLAALALKTLGCAACDDMATGGNVYEDFKAATAGGGGIVPAGIKATVITSIHDTLVAPDVTRVDEEGVRNVLMQDACPDDPVGHAGLAWDKGVWGLIYNALEEDYDAEFPCDTGLPF